jgi:hypothetical protein
MQPTSRNRAVRRLLIAAAALPLMQSACVERSFDFLFGRDFLDNRSNADRAEDLLDDLDDLLDDIF